MVPCIFLVGLMFCDVYNIFHTDIFDELVIFTVVPILLYIITVTIIEIKQNVIVKSVKMLKLYFDMDFPA
jgi:hypothetical protein